MSIKSQVEAIIFLGGDENKIKEEIYENFKPILKESEENKPFINLQWIFNWVYRDRIK